ncbi:hypothetical protein [Mucilaginibacter flavidus]|uniref:hypothetical protein n=1 Tax=Mucilaginibacter flavidus TaxID=2949309 RepID=UPI00209398C7|nr:hypothetical protein [Mucilaginibacter flavidus]MCO5946728.1 hypothetical protein [Mucilaginibacter flavidus]
MSSQDTDEKKTKKPAFIAYQVSDDIEPNGWIAIGAAWSHKDAKGFTVHLNSFPKDSRVILRATVK